MIKVVNGRKYETGPLEESDLIAGKWIAQRYGRRVYRVLCADGADVVVRNVRHPELLEALPLEGLAEEYCSVTPLS